MSTLSSVPVSGPLSSVPASAPASARSGPTSTQLGDQFRESVQAGAVEELVQEGWFVGVNGVPLGPIPLGDLRELAIAGHIDRRSLIWREGQAEWRPLGKFPGLVRVIDDGAPIATPQPEPPAASAAMPAPTASSPPARSNGAANGQHLATGFDVKRADAGERPSVWGDLDDDDDEDEQPTTVKGRVSVFPSTTGLPAPSAPPAKSLPPPAPPPSSFSAALPGPAASGRYTGVTAAVAAFPSAPPAAPSGSPASSSYGAGPSLRVATEAASDSDSSMMRSPNRTRWYLIIAAILFAFALGAIVTHLLRPSAAGKPGKAAVSGGVEGAAAASAHSALEDDEGPPSTAAGDGRVGHGRAGLSEVILGASVAVQADLGGATGAAGGASKWVGHSPRGTAKGRGLDDTALQRTYRRYTPGVRQECWQRAVDARPRGVVTSAKISASISIDPSGRVRTATVAGAPKGYPGLARCIERSLATWQFPRATAQTLTDVPFLFAAPQRRK